MPNSEKPTENYEKGMSIEACIKIANKLIEQNGLCLFLMDVKKSKQFSNRQELNTQLESLIQDLNTKFDEYFPENNLATPTRTEKGFPFLFGDGAWTAINDSEVIPKIIDYSSNNYPELNFYYNVAEDGYDENGTRTVK